MASTVTCSPEAAQFLHDASGAPLRIMVDPNDSQISNRPILCRQIKMYGGELAHGVDHADIVLVSPHSSSGRRYIRNWAGSRVILDVSWLRDCITAGRVLGHGDDWGDWLARDDGVETDEDEFEDAAIPYSKILKYRPAHERSSSSHLTSVNFPDSPGRLQPASWPSQTVPYPSPFSSSSVLSSSSDRSHFGHEASPPPTAVSLHTPHSSHYSSPPQTATPTSTQRSFAPPSYSAPLLTPLSSANFPQASPVSSMSPGYSMPTMPVDPLSVLFQSFMYSNPHLVSQAMIGMNDATSGPMPGTPIQGIHATAGMLPQHRMQAPVPDGGLSYHANVDTQDPETSLMATQPQDARIPSAKRPSPRVIRRPSPLTFVQDDDHSEPADDDLQDSRIAKRIKRRSRSSSAAAPVPPSIFKSNGNRLKFHVGMDVFKRSDVVKHIKTYGGLLCPPSEDADYFILNASEGNNAPYHKQAAASGIPVVSRKFVMQCVGEGTLLDPGPFLHSPPARRTYKKKQRPAALNELATEIKSESKLNNLPDSTRTGSAYQEVNYKAELQEFLDSPLSGPSAVIDSMGFPALRRKRKVSPITMDLTISTPLSPREMRSPTPPPESARVFAPRGYKYTPEERAYADVYALVLWTRHPDATINVICDRLAEKLPHHSPRSWASTLTRTPADREKLEVIRKIADEQRRLAHEPKEPEHSPQAEPSSSKKARLEEAEGEKDGERDSHVTVLSSDG